MLVAFLPIFVAETKIIFNYTFIAPLSIGVLRNKHQVTDIKS